MTEKRFWEKSKKAVLTPGGDPLWKCPICGNGKHVYGVESDDFRDHCSDCGVVLFYPWLTESEI